MSDCVPYYVEKLEIENRSSEQKSNDNNFLLACPIVSRSMSRRSKFRTEALGKIE